MTAATGKDLAPLQLLLLDYWKSNQCQLEHLLMDFKKDIEAIFCV